MESTHSQNIVSHTDLVASMADFMVTCSLGITQPIMSISVRREANLATPSNVLIVPESDRQSATAALKLAILDALPHVVKVLGCEAQRIHNALSDHFGEGCESGRKDGSQPWTLKTVEKSEGLPASILHARIDYFSRLRQSMLE